MHFSWLKLNNWAKRSYSFSFCELSNVQFLFKISDDLTQNYILILKYLFSENVEIYLSDFDVGNKEHKKNKNKNASQKSKVLIVIF